jgi:glucose/arabinose dehydrogenase
MAVQDPYVYLYRTTTQNVNQVVRYELKNDQLLDEKIIVNNIPAGQNHDGGRIKFGPDGALYVTTGETGNTAFAQDKNSLAGKVLRIENDEVKVYSYGHRNSEGLAWDKDGNLWATEHGRSGVLSGYDELNMIKPGVNYGWPNIQGDESKPDMQSPVINSGPSTTWAPAGMAYLDGSLYFAGLRGQTLYQYVIATGELKSQLSQKYGRMRAVAVGPDGFLYVSTSNKDGRGIPKEGDDQILKISPKAL